MSLSANALTSGPYPQAFAKIEFTGFEFFDANMNPDSPVVGYTLVEAVPEPSTVFLLGCGLVAIGWRRARVC